MEIFPEIGPRKNFLVPPNSAPGLRPCTVYNCTSKSVYVDLYIGYLLFKRNHLLDEWFWSPCFEVFLWCYTLHSFGVYDAVYDSQSSGATRNLSWGCSTFWGKAHPPLVSSALHSPPSSCTRCFPTTLNMSSLPPTHLKAGGLGFSPGFF